MTYPPGDMPPERPEDRPGDEEARTANEPGAHEERVDETRSDETRVDETRSDGPGFQERPGYAEQPQQSQQPQQPPHGYTGQQRPAWDQPPQRPTPPPYAYPPGPMPYAPDHPRATIVLVLGIVGVVMCQVLAPIAWVLGKRTLDEIDASQGRWGGRGSAQAGYVLGIIGTVLLGLALALLLVYLIIMALVVGGGLMSTV